ncbi:MAG: flagellar assembly protein FliH [Actinomycetota bacterium]
MANIRKYMFDLDFSPQAAQPKVAEPEPQPAYEEDEAPLPPAPTFTEEELQLAREAAWEDGHQTGLAEGNEIAARILADAMTALSNHLHDLKVRQEEIGDVNARTAVRVAQAVLKKVLPRTCEAHAFEEVTRVVEECLGHVLDEPRIIVRVSAELVDPVRERLEAVAGDHGFEGRVVVQADPRLTASDCKVEWTDGGAERDQVRLLAEIDEVVERAVQAIVVE